MTSGFLRGNSVSSLSFGNSGNTSFEAIEKLEPLRGFGFGIASLPPEFFALRVENDQCRKSFRPELGLQGFVFRQGFRAEWFEPGQINFKKHQIRLSVAGELGRDK